MDKDGSEAFSFEEFYSFFRDLKENWHKMKLREAVHLHMARTTEDKKPTLEELVEKGVSVELVNDYLVKDLAWTLRVDCLGLRVVCVDSPTHSREITNKESTRRTKYA